MNDKCKKALSFIEGCSTPPTHRQIQAHIGAGAGTVVDTLGELRAEGLVQPADGTAGIKLTSRKGYNDLLSENKALEAKNKNLKAHNQLLLGEIDGLFQGMQAFVNQTPVDS